MVEVGEFIMCVFLNGRMDLLQVEVVVDLIFVELVWVYDVAMNQMCGNFLFELKELCDKLIYFVFLVEFEFDFVEEDVEFVDWMQLLVFVCEVLNYINRLKRFFELGNVLKFGILVIIVGELNVGKSILLNELLGEECVIVSDIVGIICDVIEDMFNIDGMFFCLIDIVGICENVGEIEVLGIQCVFEKICQVCIVLVLVDGFFEKLVQEVWECIEFIWMEYLGKVVIGVVNKFDLLKVNLVGFFVISVRIGVGVGELKKQFLEVVLGDFDMQLDIIVINVWYFEVFFKVEELLEKV